MSTRRVLRARAMAILRLQSSAVLRRILHAKSPLRYFSYGVLVERRRNVTPCYVSHSAAFARKWFVQADPEDDGADPDYAATLIDRLDADSRARRGSDR